MMWLISLLLWKQPILIVEVQNLYSLQEMQNGKQVSPRIFLEFSRFSRFEGKIIHIIADYSDLVQFKLNDTDKSVRIRK